MKYILATLIILSTILSCDNSKDNIKIEKYFTLKYGSYEDNGEIVNYVIPNINKIPDSTGKAITKYSRRIDYLLTNRINFDSIRSLLPDSISANKAFKKMLNKQEFKNYFKSIVKPNSLSKKTFTEEEMMSIASKFFFVIKEGNEYFRKTCVGEHGNTEKQNQREDYTLLEAVIFDAIFDRITQENKSEINFIDNEKQYRKSAIKTFENISSENQLLEIRNSVHISMKNDKDLKKFLLSYIKINKHNIPFKIKTVANNTYK